MMELPHSIDELIELTVELCARNRFERNVYIRPLIYKAAEDVGVRLTGVPDAFAIVALPVRKILRRRDGLARRG